MMTWTVNAVVKNLQMERLQFIEHPSFYVSSYWLQIHIGSEIPRGSDFQVGVFRLCQ
jgi:hypothetical protein